jgi:hypothetical protein
MFLPSTPNIASVSPNRRKNRRFPVIFHFNIKAYYPATPTIICQETRHVRPWRESSMTADRDRAHGTAGFTIPDLLKRTGGSGKPGLPTIPRKCPGIASKNFIQTRQYATTSNKSDTTRPGP